MLEQIPGFAAYLPPSIVTVLVGIRFLVILTVARDDSRTGSRFWSHERCSAGVESRKICVERKVVGSIALYAAVHVNSKYCWLRAPATNLPPFSWQHASDAMRVARIAAAARVRTDPHWLSSGARSDPLVSW